MVGGRVAYPPPDDPMNDPLLAAALAARRHAFAPYSKFQVGAAIEDSDGRIHTGCNVENATYGLTVCAERVAVFKAISEGVRSQVPPRRRGRRYRRSHAALRRVPPDPLGVSAATSRLRWSTRAARLKRINCAISSRSHSMLRICSFFLFVFALSAEQADWIWSARYVITEDPAHRVIENGAVAVRGARIVAVGPRAEIDARFHGLHRLDRPMPSSRRA
jgi:hypothetical protein